MTIAPLGPNESSGRVALPVFRQILLGVYRERLVGPLPAFPAALEQIIDAHLQGNQPNEPGMATAVENPN